MCPGTCQTAASQPANDTVSPSPTCLSTSLMSLLPNTTHSGNTFFKLPSRTGGTRILLDDLSLPQVANSYANDTEAASGGIQVGQLYHTAGVVKIRLS